MQRDFVYKGSEVPDSTSTCWQKMLHQHSISWHLLSWELSTVHTEKPHWHQRLSLKTLCKSSLFTVWWILIITSALSCPKASCLLLSFVPTCKVVVQQQYMISLSPHNCAFLPIIQHTQLYVLVRVFFLMPKWNCKVVPWKNGCHLRCDYKHGPTYAPWKKHQKSYI